MTGGPACTPLDAGLASTKYSGYRANCNHARAVLCADVRLKTSVSSMLSSSLVSWLCGLGLGIVPFAFAFAFPLQGVGLAKTFSLALGFAVKLSFAAA